MFFYGSINRIRVSCHDHLMIISDQLKGYSWYQDLCISAFYHFRFSEYLLEFYICTKTVVTFQYLQKLQKQNCFHYKVKNYICKQILGLQIYPSFGNFALMGNGEEGKLNQGDSDTSILNISPGICDNFPLSVNWIQMYSGNGLLRLSLK